jgi:hypothetical protein
VTEHNIGPIAELESYQHPAMMNQQLLWRRQFALARKPLRQLSNWQYHPVGPYHLYGHPDLEINVFSDSKKTVVLLGYLFDVTETTKGNSDILADIASHSQTPEEFFLRLKPHTGRYAFIFHSSEHSIVVQDALALREVYYCTANSQLICGSSSNLLAALGHPEITETNDPEIQKFYKNQFKNAKWVGDRTYYENVRHLLPNHYLDITKLQARRYWPTQTIRPLKFEAAVQQSCAFLQGALKAAAVRYPLMMAITAGTDSRTMLAASKDLADKIYFFINKERDLNDQSPDIRIPRAIFASLGLPFHVHEILNEVDPEFREVFLRNTFFASERILPTIFTYYRRHGDKLNILGIGEIGRTRYGKQPPVLSGYRMAYAMGYKDSDYAIKTCADLLPEMSATASKCGVNMMTLLYWEQTMGNWGTVGNSESDIAIEEFDPYDSHFLYETFLGVNDKYTTYTNNRLFREMIRQMWPELLQWPINPPGDSKKDKITYFLKKMRVYPMLKQLKYRVSHARHLRQIPK